MVGVAQDKLQGMPARRQLKAGFSLSSTEMDVLLVGWNGHLNIERFVYVNQQMMMPSVRSGDTSWRNTHVA